MDDGFARSRASGAAIEKHVAVGVAANEVARFGDVDRARPAVGMHGHEFAGRDADFENAHAFILEEQVMGFRRRD